MGPQVGVCCRDDQVRSGGELRLLREQLVVSLEDLLLLGRERLAEGPGDELRDRAHLARRRAGHMVSVGVASSSRARQSTSKR